MGNSKIDQAHREAIDCFDRYHRQEYLAYDPLFELRRGHSPQDYELLSFIIAGLSYGRVEQIMKSFSGLLEIFAASGCGTRGEGLCEMISNSPKLRPTEKKLEAWKHRLNTGADIFQLLGLLRNVLREHGSLAVLFQKSFSENASDQLHNFSGFFRSDIDFKRSKVWKGTGPSWFAPTPKDNSPCKRMLMWLRWMIRADHIDPGIWQNSDLLDSKLPAPSPSRLFYPVDTHIFQWGKAHGIASGTTPNWKATQSITNYFRKIDPEDPVKFDFALCTAGKLNFRFG